MKPQSLTDGRTIADEVMDHMRQRVVHAIREKGYSPEVVAEVFGFSRSSVYQWLTWYDRGGYDALTTVKAPGAEAVISEEMDAWLKETVLTSTPVAHGYETRLWSRAILADLLKVRFGIKVSGVTVSLHLKKLGLSYQTPVYRDIERDEQEVEAFLSVTFPKIQRLAKTLGADIGFEDEAGVEVRARSGRTWGLVGHPPEIAVPQTHGGYNVLSLITPQGRLDYRLAQGTLDATAYIHFLDQVLQGRERPLILLVDRAPFHRARAVREWVRAHRAQVRVFFLPRRSPERNPDEQVWNEIKNNQIGKQPVKNKTDLKKRLKSALESLKGKTDRIRSFFQLPETKYATV